MNLQKTFLNISIAAVIALCGCARFSTVQRDHRDGTIIDVTTKATSWTLWDSQSALAKWKASQTEKTQGAEVGGLSQQSTGTNAVQALKEINLILQKVP